MFNLIKGERKMFNKQPKSKKAYSLDNAIGYKLALEKLNDRDNQFYFIATDMETANSTMIDHHNKSVEVA